MAEKLNNLNGKIASRVDGIYGGFFSSKAMYKNRNWLIILNVITDIVMVGILFGGLLGKEFTISSLGAILATFGVIFLAYGSMLSFPFNMAQNVTWFITAMTLGFYADVPMAIAYLVTQALAIRKWKTKRTGGVPKVETWDFKSIIKMGVGIVVLTIVIAFLSDYYGGNQVWLDSINNSTAIIAQIFQMGLSPLGNWMWLLTDVLQFAQYGKAVQLGEAIAWGAMIQTIVQTVNAFRSIINWHFMPKVTAEEKSKWL